MVKDHSDSEKGNPLPPHRLLLLINTKGSFICTREREMFYLTTHSTHFIYGYMASDIWLRTILIVRKETCCRHIGYSCWLTARVLLYAPERERNVLFNDALNIFYLRLYGVRHMVKDHSDSEKGNLLPPHRLLLLINSKGSFICTREREREKCFI